MKIAFVILAVVVGIAQLILTFKLFFRNYGDYAVFTGIAAYFGLTRIFA